MSMATSFPRSPSLNYQPHLTATWCFVLIATQAAPRAAARGGRVSAKTEAGLTENYDIRKPDTHAPQRRIWPFVVLFEFHSNPISGRRQELILSSNLAAFKRLPDDWRLSLYALPVSGSIS